MKAFDIAGKRGAAGKKILQGDFAKRLGISENGLRDVENGKIEITGEFYRFMHDTLDAMIAEMEILKREEVAA
jgi:transcriptional regulator with XRE-family HTH domain